MSLKVLIADDEFDNRAILKAALEAAGCSVLEAVNGLEAVSAARAELPDLVLMDLSMPKLNGWEAATALRADARTAGLRIVAFTAHALAGDEEKAKAAGCDDYVAKPCVPREVVGKVLDWGARRRRAGADPARALRHPGGGSGGIKSHEDTE